MKAKVKWKKKQQEYKMKWESESRIQNQKWIGEWNKDITSLT